MGRAITVIFWIALMAYQLWVLENNKTSWPWLSKVGVILAIISLFKM